MSETILVPIDGSEPAGAALDHATEQFPDAEIVLLYVINPMAEYSRHRSFPGYTSEDEFTSESEKADALFAQAKQRHDTDWDRIETKTVIGRPDRAIVDTATDHDADAIVLGSHGRDGVSRVLLGSVAESVVRRAPVPVTVVR